MIGLMIMTHETLGESYSKLAQHFFGEMPEYLSIIGVRPDEEPEAVMARAQKEAERLAFTDGILLLADVFGATPCNVGRRLLRQHRMVMLTGLNAPMMVKAVQEAKKSDDLLALAEAVRQSALAGIMLILPEEEQGVC
ncbi:PTS mannose transporter subunit IIA [Eikenella longinqua]|uniref:PTS mannose transporter subunit IIA n=1 Tax=Eikenella longinqua TaxID=1795827 RepID=A0A1A9S1V5_9NEIS|nr:PTS mannose transporter subunit IIA [Eikenella longinqua]OAM31069.1 PTS mannose transporter subunit IIA [Eikenella longinqua]